MAKRPRMGRNLNALLGSAARERTPTTDDDSSDHKADRTDNAVVQAVSDSDHLSDQPADSNEKKGGVDDEALLGEPGTVDVGTPQGSGEEPAVAPVATTTVAVNSTKSDNLRDADPVHVSSNASGERLIMLGVEKIRRGTYQPRRLFDQELLQELADSIRAEGMIQPIIVRPFADGFELVAGERRWRASQLAGIDRIPAIVRDMEDRSVAAVSVIENIQRKDLNPLEEAAAFQRLCDEFGMTHKAVSEAVGRSRASVTNLMRLLELHDDVKVMVDKGELEMGHARALLGAPRTHQTDIARRIIKQRLTVRAVEKYVRSLDADGNEVSTPTAPGAADPDIERLSKKLGEKLGAKVQISHKGNGTGKLQISYSSVSELQGILAHIK
ncbi:MAG: ParB/RepB/Spo0J family partition protein [Granulosicoccus sp.]